ncbi:SPA1-related 4 [Actinidia rufa]|uniref:SPA1-related 4 n=1 Tax=Actinidia rufa TaxID=165716 RepID=A0A7J0DGC9_9ERIC|nr:SPA1-related 4 [Actinidia rufa]
MTMEGSSESGWQKSDSSREFNTSAVSDRNLRLFHGSRFRSSGEASHDSGFTRGRKERDRVLLAHTDLHRNPVDLSGVCEDEHIHKELLFIMCGLLALSCHLFNHVSFIESVSCSADSGSDSMEDGPNSQTAEFKGSSSPLPHDSDRHRTQFGTENSQLEINQTDASHLVSEASCLQSSSVYPMPKILEVGSNLKQAEEKKHTFPMKQILLMETNWYTSPEEVAGSPSSGASDIYRLGVLLFELFSTFSSAEEKSSTMSSLRHRVLPPQLLLNWAKEAGFCLWLLHPDPSSRPKMR